MKEEPLSQKVNPQVHCICFEGIDAEADLVLYQSLILTYFVYKQFVQILTYVQTSTRFPFLPRHGFLLHLNHVRRLTLHFGLISC